MVTKRHRIEIDGREHLEKRLYSLDSTATEEGHIKKQDTGNAASMGEIKLYNVLVKTHIWTRLFGRPRPRKRKYYKNDNKKGGCSSEIMTKWK
jgi:hypothetical protein